MADLLAYGEDIIGFPGGEAKAKVKLMKLLWENPDPTASFAGQNVNLASSDYNLLLVIPNWNPSLSRETQPVIVRKGTNGAYLNFADDSSSGPVNYYRSFVRVSDTQYTFSNAIGNKGATDNTKLIPYQIYGIKLEQEIPVVAENVSTLAANCLLSDGETSVEDCVEDSGWIQIDTTGVYYRKIGKQVTIKGSVTTGTSWTIVATLPEGCRPSSNIYRCLRFQTTSSNDSLFIGSTGVIQTVGTSPIQFMESFLID